MAESTSWYYSKYEIDKYSPSRRDGIDIKVETFHRSCYTKFLQVFGRRLSVSLSSIATSIVFCQRFFTRQSLAKNDPKTVAIICMFIAAKAEGSPRPVSDVVSVSNMMLYTKLPSREMYEKQKETVLIGERFVLTVLGFDLEIEHPYTLMLDWVKRSVKAKDVKRLSQASLNFINDSLTTSLCLQFGPSQIAAAAIYLGLSICKMELPSDGEVWWREFDVTKHQLSEICDQTLDLYVQKFVTPVMRDGPKQSNDGETNIMSRS